MLLQNCECSALKQQYMHMLIVFLLDMVVYENIFKVNHHKAIYAWLKDLINCSHKSVKGVDEPKWNR